MLMKPFSMQGRATRLLPIFIYRGNSANANSKESNVLKVFFSWSLHHFNSILAMCRSSLLLVQMLHSSQTLEDTLTTSNARPRKLGCRHKAPTPHCRRRPYEEVQHTGQKFLKLVQKYLISHFFSSSFSKEITSSTYPLVRIAIKYSEIFSQNFF